MMAPRSSWARSASASSRCSTATYSSLRLSASLNAASSTSRIARLAGGVALPPSMRGSRATRSSVGGAHCGGRLARLLQHTAGDAGLLVEQREQQMVRGDLGIATFEGRALRGGERLLRFDCQLLKVHGSGCLGGS